MNGGQTVILSGAALSVAGAAIPSQILLYVGLGLIALVVVFTIAND